MEIEPRSGHFEPDQKPVLLPQGAMPRWKIPSAVIVKGTRSIELPDARDQLDVLRDIPLFGSRIARAQFDRHHVAVAFRADGRFGRDTFIDTNIGRRGRWRGTGRAGRSEKARG
jgi:hypothetical protein